MLDSANASEDSNLQHPDIQQDVLSTESLRTPHSMHSYPPSSVSFEAEMSVIHSPATENEENNESWLQFMISFWMKFQRFMIRLFGYMDTSFTDVLPHQKFTVFEADNLQVEYHYDIPGITVVVSEGQTPAWKAPECLLKICCTGARLYYSPILEKARCVLLERFFPPTFENFEVSIVDYLGKTIHLVFLDGYKFKKGRKKKAPSLFPSRNGVQSQSQSAYDRYYISSSPTGQRSTFF